MSEFVLRYVKTDWARNDHRRFAHIVERTCDTCGCVQFNDRGQKLQVGWEGIHHLSGGKHYCLGCRPALGRVTNGR